MSADLMPLTAEEIARSRAVILADELQEIVTSGSFAGTGTLMRAVHALRAQAESAAAQAEEIALPVADYSKPVHCGIVEYYSAFNVRRLIAESAAAQAAEIAGLRERLQVACEQRDSLRGELGAARTKAASVTAETMRAAHFEAQAEYWRQRAERAEAQTIAYLALIDAHNAKLVRICGRRDALCVPSAPCEGIACPQRVYGIDVPASTGEAPI